MRLADSPEEAAWREEVQQFLRDNLAPELRRRSTAGEDAPEHGKALDKWRTALSGRGWVAPAWPKEYGGAGLSVIEQFIMNEEFAQAGAPRLGGMGVGWAGPTIIVHGTSEQKAEHLPPILRGDTVWCQGFSEPDAGSDLASLKTAAVPDGDDYLINGTKIWTSGAQNAHWMFMLARTDPNAPKHRGITYFLLDMKSPGITIQPLVQMSGAAGFNQVHFDNVRVPKTNIVGEVNRGWYVATTTLDFERAGTASAVNIARAVDNMLDWARANKRQLNRNPVMRYQLIDRYIEAKVSKMLSHRVAYMQSSGQIPNYEASMAKLFSAEALQRTARTAMQMVGMYGLVWDEASEFASAEAQFARAYVQTVSSTIMGGTSEIQRGIIAQRGLGMPRS